MNCRNCGENVKNNNRFCTACGQPILIGLNLIQGFQEEEPYLYKTALIHYEDRQYDRAKNDLIELILKHPTNSKYQNLMGCIYLKQGKDNLAVLHLEKALELDPFSWQSYYNLGIIASKRREYDKAKMMFELVLQFNRNHLSSIYNLGTILLKEGSYRAAIAELTKVNNTNPNHTNARINLNLALKKLNN